MYICIYIYVFIYMHKYIHIYDSSNKYISPTSVDIPNNILLPLSTLPEYYNPDLGFEI